MEADKFDMGKGSFYFNPITHDPLEAILQRDFGIGIGIGNGNGDGDGNGNGKTNENEDSEEEQTTTALDEPNTIITNREKERKAFLTHAEGNGAFYAPNIWPHRTLPELQDTAMEMGGLIRDIGKLVARQCDAYVLSQCDIDADADADTDADTDADADTDTDTGVNTYSPGKIQHVIDNSLCCKARLLHYFPVVAAAETDNDADANSNGVHVHAGSGNSICCDNENENQDGTVANDGDFSDWCGWHNDHCSLTGLVPAMYFNGDGEEIPCPDPAAGLYIKSRNGDLFHVQVPSDALAFQIGGESF